MRHWFSILLQNQMLSNWHWKVIDPPIRTERTDSSENKIKIVRMILHIVINLSKQPPLAVKKTLENLQVGNLSMKIIQTFSRRRRWWDSSRMRQWWRQFWGIPHWWILISISSRFSTSVVWRSTRSPYGPYLNSYSLYNETSLPLNSYLSTLSTMRHHG